MSFKNIIILLAFFLQSFCLLTAQTSQNYMNQNLETLPDDALTSHDLIRLNASGNRLSGIVLGENIWQNVKYLYMNENNLTHVPESFRQLKQLSYLDLRNNPLKEIPSWLSELPELATLRLSRESLILLPGALEPLTHFVFADSKSELTIRMLLKKPRGIITVREVLSVLTVWHKVEEEIVLKPERELFYRMGAEDPSELPFDTMPSRLNPSGIEHIIWKSDSTSDSITAGLENFTTVDDFRTKKEINLSGRLMDILPDWLRLFKDLEVLSLENCQLKALPSWLSDLKNLKVLNLSGGPLPYIPAVLEHWLEEREEIILKSCSLQSLPAWLINGKSLKGIDLSGNYLTEIPESFFKGKNELEKINFSTNLIERISYDRPLTSLKFVNLNHNRLTEIPPFIYAGEELSHFDISGNRLVFISEKLSRWKNLDTLNLAENSLLYIPAELSLLSTIKTLDLSGNYIDSVPVEIMSKSGTHNYLLNPQFDGRYLKETLFRSVLEKGSVRELQVFLDYGMDPDYVFEDHLTPLVISTLSGRGSDVTRLLWEYGADINLTMNEAGLSPSGAAVLLLDDEAVMWMAARGADLQHEDKSARTMLHLASEGIIRTDLRRDKIIKYDRMVLFLLSSGVSHLITDSQGLTFIDTLPVSLREETRKIVNDYLK